MSGLLFMCVVTMCSSSFSMGHTDSLGRLTQIIARQYKERQRSEMTNVASGRLTSGFADREAVVADSESEDQFERNLVRMKNALMKEKQRRRMWLQRSWIGEDGGFRGTPSTTKNARLLTSGPPNTGITTTTTAAPSTAATTAAKPSTTTPTATTATTFTTTPTTTATSRTTTTTTSNFIDLWCLPPGLAKQIAKMKTKQNAIWEILTRSGWWRICDEFWTI